MDAYTGRARSDRGAEMTLFLAVSPPETIGALSSRSSRETATETKHPKSPAKPAVSPETVPETNPPIVSSSRLSPLLGGSR